MYNEGRLKQPGRFLKGQTQGAPSVETSLELVVERHNGTSTVHAVGELDMASVARLRECLSMLSGTVVVDLRAVSFLDSTGVSVLVGERKRLRDDGGELKLRKPQGMVRTAIEVLAFAGWIED